MQSSGASGMSSSEPRSKSVFHSHFLGDSPKSDRGRATPGPPCPPSRSPSAAYGPPHHQHLVQLYHPAVKRWIPVKVEFSLRLIDGQILMLLDVGRTRKTSEVRLSPLNMTSMNSQYSMSLSENCALPPPVGGSRSSVAQHWSTASSPAQFQDPMSNLRPASRRRTGRRKELEVYNFTPRAALRPLSSELREGFGLTPVDSDQQTYRTTCSGAVTPCVDAFFENSRAVKAMSSMEDTPGASCRVSQEWQPPSTEQVGVDCSPPFPIVLPDGRRSRSKISHPVRQLFGGMALPYSNPQTLSCSAELFDVLVECDHFPLQLEELSAHSAEESGTGKTLSRFLKFFSFSKGRRDRSLTPLTAGRGGGTAAPDTDDQSSSSSYQHRTRSTASSAQWIESEEGFGISPGAQTSGRSSVLLKSGANTPRFRFDCTAVPRQDSSGRYLPSHIILRSATQSDFILLVQDYTTVFREAERWSEAQEDQHGRHGLRVPVGTTPSEPLVSDEDLLSPLTAASPTMTIEPAVPITRMWMDYVQYSHNPQNALRYAHIPPLFWNVMLDYVAQEIFTFHRSVVVVEDLSSWRGPYTLMQGSKRHGHRSFCADTNTERRDRGATLKAEESSCLSPPCLSFKEVKVKLAWSPPHTVQATQHLLSPFLLNKEVRKRRGNDDVNEVSPEEDWPRKDHTEDSFVTFPHVFSCVTSDSILCFNSFGTLKLKIPLTDIRVVLFSAVGSPSSSDTKPEKSVEQESRQRDAAALMPFCSFVVRDNSHDASNEHDFAVTITFLPELNQGCNARSSELGTPGSQASTKDSFGTSQNPSRSEDKSATATPKRDSEKLKMTWLREMNKPTTTLSSSGKMSDGAERRDKQRGEVEEAQRNLRAVMNALAVVLPQPGTVHAPTPVTTGDHHISSDSASTLLSKSALKLNGGSLKSRSSGPTGITQSLLKYFPPCGADNGPDGTPGASRRVSPGPRGFNDVSSRGGAEGCSGSGRASEEAWNLNCVKTAAERRDFLKSSCCFVPVGPHDVRHIRSAHFGFSTRRHHGEEECTSGGDGVMEMVLSRRMAALSGLPDHLKSDANANFSRVSGPLLHVLSSLSSEEDSEKLEASPLKSKGGGSWLSDRGRDRDRGYRGQEGMEWERPPVSRAPNQYTVPRRSSDVRDAEEEFVPIKPMKKKSSSSIRRAQMPRE